MLAAAGGTKRLTVHKVAASIIDKAAASRTQSVPQQHSTRTPRPAVHKDKATAGGTIRLAVQKEAASIKDKAAASRTTNIPPAVRKVTASIKDKARCWWHNVSHSCDARETVIHMPSQSRTQLTASGAKTTPNPSTLAEQ